MLQDYKPIQYDEIPHDFNQSTHFITQVAPVDKGDHIFIGVQVHELELEDDENIDEDIF